jgi:acetyl esterase
MTHDIDLAQTSISRRTGLKLAGAVAGGGVAIQSLHTFAQDATPMATPEPGAPPPPGGVEADPQMEAVLDALSSFNAPPLASVSPQVGRNLPSFANAVQHVLTDQGLPPLEPVGGIEHVLIPALDGEEIVARIYHPAGATPDVLLPVLVYFHGGGFVIANLDTYDASCRALSNAASCIVASVAYRQAPEMPFPTAVDDAYAATQFFLGGSGVVGGDPERVAVAGESAGGNLATVVCLRARDEGGLMPIHQLLVYPVATFAPEGESLESIEQFANAAPLNAAALEWFGGFYLPNPDDAANPYASPLEADDLSGIPPATIILAEIDPLQSQGFVYVEELEAAGVAVSTHFYEGVTHEFFGMTAVVDKAADAVAVSASELMAAFGN